MLSSNRVLNFCHEGRYSSKAENAMDRYLRLCAFQNCLRLWQPPHSRHMLGAIYFLFPLPHWGLDGFFTGPLDICLHRVDRYLQYPGDAPYRNALANHFADQWFRSLVPRLIPVERLLIFLTSAAVELLCAIFMLPGFLTGMVTKFTPHRTR
jgi:hypothetical protein